MSNSKRSLTQMTGRGVSWSTGQSIVNKLLSFVAQIVLAWLLVPEDFGLVGMTLTVVAIAGVLQSAGLNDVIVQRGPKAALWGNVTLWMSLTFGLIAMTVVLVAAVPLSRLYDEPRVAPLMAVVALDFPLRALAAPAIVWLRSRMRFGWLAAADTTANSGRLIAAIVLAWLGFGAWSLILPIPLATLLRTGVLLYAARPRLRWRPRFRRWRPVLGRSGMMLGSAAAAAIIAQSDYFILAAVFDAATLGLYFFAFQLSNQAILLFSNTLAGVLLPALSQIRREPERQRAAFLRAARLFALGILPICFFQAALAEPTFRLFFEPKWLDAVPLVAWLSIGVGFKALAWPAKSLIKSQGRFMLLMKLEFAAAAAFIVLVWGAAVFGGVETVAGVVAGFAVVYGLTVLWLALGFRRRSAGDLARALGVPMLGAGGAAAMAHLAAGAVPLDLGRGAPALIVGAAVGGAAYLSFLAFFARGLREEIARLRRRGAASSPPVPPDASAG